MCKAIKDYGKQKKKLGKEEGISLEKVKVLAKH